MAVNPMDKEHKDPCKLDQTTSCMVQAENVEKTPRHCVLVRKKLAQRKGFKFYQTRSNAIIFYDTLPAYCIPNAIVMETREIICEKVYVSPRPPPKIFLKLIGWSNWIQKLLEVVETPNKSNQNQKPNYQVRWDLWVSNHQVFLPRKSKKMSCLVAKAQTQERERLVKSCASFCWTCR